MCYNYIMIVVYTPKNIVISDIYGFDIQKTFECGQCFRFDKMPDGSYSGVAFDKLLSVCQNGNEISISGISKEEFENLFYDFFDLGRDYRQIDDVFLKDSVLCNIVPFSTGIRILKQEPFETLISFIISASNNIPRIKKIIASLCENFGPRYTFEDKVYYGFPSAKKLADLELSDLAVIRAGYRDKYILDCAKKVASGELELDKVAKSDYETAAKMLMSVKGIGRKVADCALLYGFGFIESFPKDVWIKRILGILYSAQTDEGIDFYGYGGIAQQYLFYYARLNDITQKG